MKGIDISAWQEDVDWQAVKDAGIEFVIIKLGQGYRRDSMFINHINNAVENGLKVGVYVYSNAKCVDDAVAEAVWTDQQIKDYLNGQCPEMGIWFDMEDPSIESAGVDITGLCAAFVDHLYDCGYGYVGVYSSYSWFTYGNIDAGALNCPIWCAQYNSQCDYEGPNLHIWQYTDHFSDELPYDGNVYYGKEV